MMEYYTGVKKEQLLTHVTTWMNLTAHVPKVIRQKGTQLRDYYCDSEKGKSNF